MRAGSARSSPFPSGLLATAASGPTNTGASRAPRSVGQAQVERGLCGQLLALDKARSDRDRGDAERLQFMRHVARHPVHAPRLHAELQVESITNASAGRGVRSMFVLLAPGEPYLSWRDGCERGKASNLNS